MTYPNISGLDENRHCGTRYLLQSVLLLVPQRRRMVSAPWLIVIDKDSIEFGGTAVSRFPRERTARPDRVGGRARFLLPFFAVNVGSLFVLRSGMNGSDSWFAFQREPIMWETRAGQNDALENFALAGWSRITRCDGPARVIAVRCRRRHSRPRGPRIAPGGKGVQDAPVVYDQDSAMSADGLRIHLQGPNWGMVAFRVSAIMNVDSTWPGNSRQALAMCGRRVSRGVEVL